MSDEQGPAVPDEVGDTGVQHALGERRRRRLTERSGQVDLDATMSHWPVTEPPSSPRPVVRPVRPSVPGVATGPVLPPPGHLVVGALLEARRVEAAGDTTSRATAGGRRERRRGGRGGVPAAGMAAAAAAAVSERMRQDEQDEQDEQDGQQVQGDQQVQDGAPDATGVPSEPAVRGAPGPEGAGELDWEADLVRAAPGSRTRRRPQPDVVEAVTGAAAPTRPVPTPTAVDRSGASVPSGSGRPRRGLRTALSWPPGRRELAVAAVALAVVLLLVVVVTGLLSDDGRAEAVQPVSGGPAQQTLAVTLAGSDGALAAGAVVGVDSAQVSTLLLPANLILTVADASEIPLSQAVSLGADSVRRGLEDTLVLRLDGTVLLQPAQLSTLVDAVGGVVVDVGTEVVTEDVVVTVGEDQRLAGAQAAAYAALVVDGEPVEAGLARFGAVLGALLRALPADADGVAEALTAAEVSATAGEPAAASEVLAAAAERAAAGNSQAVVLPTTLRSAGGAERRGVDEEAARAELQSRFAGALLPVAAVGEVRVLVRNGVGTAGLIGQARDRLVAAGLRYVRGGNAPAFDQEATVVLVPSQDEADRDRGEAVAAALGVGPGSLQVNNEAMVDIDVVVVLGGDFAGGNTTDPTSSSETTPGDAP